ncbi:TPA: 50S ribosomal protein L29 [Candidatus Woesearchaeota archaeon]|nr:50S ribosomal protein L29 [Candidatus Woesearchaeota archaeon]HIH04677.1 50S ribosomal protein L29 [Candidatus Woesearchaeota archaeon]HIH91379.1 50S ribosomal protein L29 [Candidatus Woesearchaeota archaeon]HII64459.1 50S ribosomal protein L29 [Candidatus Woesearchaeota archaeon]HII65774.1 50S ribosomal protein L29 [Candidatus Woesearchaeota archaeon]
MRMKELKGMSSKEIDEKLLEMKKELLKIRGQIAVGTVPKNPGRSKVLRRTIARAILVKSQQAQQDINQGGPKAKA